MDPIIKIVTISFTDAAYVIEETAPLLSKDDISLGMDLLKIAYKSKKPDASENETVKV